MRQDFIPFHDALEFAAQVSAKPVSKHNLMYLVTYGKVEAVKENGETFLNQSDLNLYYKSLEGSKENQWKEKYGDEINWHLSFENLREVDTTKHVHRLHPYKGKFIPQLVEYFLDEKTDQFKTKTYFKKNDILLDPFAGSGTTIVQANESGMHAIGIDVSSFNCMIGRVKMCDIDANFLKKESAKIQQKIDGYKNQIVENYLRELDAILLKHNKALTAPIIKKKSTEFGLEKRDYIKKIWSDFSADFVLLKKKFVLEENGVTPCKSSSFLDRWYFKTVRDEMNLVFAEIKKISNQNLKQVLAVILSRAIRSCRATTHSDLATLVDPQIEPYYCHKHNKICRPIMTMKDMFKRYSADTANRITQFQELRSNSLFHFINADAREADISSELEKKNPQLAKIFGEKKIAGIFSSPPYVGQIDYHEQHAYAYELFGFERNDKKEIGPLFQGQGQEARKSYVEGISQVLLNCKKFLRDDFDVFLVANDKHNLYPTIAEKSGMKIVNQFKRPVLNRTEKVRNLYSEEIFHLKQK
jgi:DNA modification methylase